MSVDYASVFAEGIREAEKSTRPGVVLRCFRDIAPKPVCWLWPGRIPLGKLTLLIGDPGLGKSLLTIDIASRVTRGGTFPDGTKCQVGTVVLVSAEDDPADTIRPRLDSSGADVSRVHILESVRVQLADGSLSEKSFNLETDIRALEDVVRAHPDVRLVVIDPISAYLGGADSHSNAEVRGLLSPLAALAAKHNVAVVCITHLRKSPGAAVYRAIASIAFTAAARAVWAVAADPKDAARRLVLAVKQNLSARICGLAFRVETHNGGPGLTWEVGTVALTANELLGGGEVYEQSERCEAKVWLKDFLADGPVAVKRIQREAKAAGLAWMTIRRAKDALSVIAQKSGFAGGWEWCFEYAQSQGAQSTDGHVSAFEQPTGNTKSTGTGGVEDAHGSD